MSNQLANPPVSETQSSNELVKSVDTSGLSGANLKTRINLSKLNAIANFIMKNKDIAQSKILTKDSNKDIWIEVINFAITDDNGNPTINPYDQTHATKLSMTSQQREQHGDVQIGNSVDKKGKPITLGNAYVGSGQETGVVTFDEGDAFTLDANSTSNEY
tara:strand:- start:128 stop:607 length:480 start_codon:yes stop_codon:yes gene_type:complete